MSQSNIFSNQGSNNGVLINDAYKFQTFCPYISNSMINKLSPKCIFCSSIETIALVKDGDFRQCTRCKKQFKALFIKK